MGGEELKSCFYRLGDRQNPRILSGGSGTVCRLSDTLFSPGSLVNREWSGEGKREEAPGIVFLLDVSPGRLAAKRTQ